jgi:hypothetical protein
MRRALLLLRSASSRPLDKRPREELRNADTADQPAQKSVKLGEFARGGNIPLPERVLLIDQDATQRYDLDESASTLRKSFLSRWALGRFSNKELTELSFYATQAGASGVSDLAMDPSKRGDNHARHIRKVLELVTVLEKLYYVRIPVWDKVSNPQSKHATTRASNCKHHHPHNVSTSACMCGLLTSLMNIGLWILVWLCT